MRAKKVLLKCIYKLVNMNKGDYLCVKFFKYVGKTAIHVPNRIANDFSTIL